MSPLSGSVGVASSRATVQQLEEKLQNERQRYREISKQLTEIDELIKELRPRAETCQEEKNRLQVTLTEKRLNLQHLADGVRDKYGVDLGSVEAPDGNAAASIELMIEIEDLRARIERNIEDANLIISRYRGTTLDATPTATATRPTINPTFLMFDNLSLKSSMASPVLTATTPTLYIGYS